jgi:hypothetical protein
MNEITIGQVGTFIAIITAFWAFTEKINKTYKNIMKPLKDDILMLSNMTYQMLDHMATNNNTGGMKKALDEFNAYQRKKAQE